MSIIALPIESAAITESFTMRIRLSSGDPVPTGKAGYSYSCTYTANGVTYTASGHTATIPTADVNAMLTSLWNTKNVSGSWVAHLFYNKGGATYVGDTDPANIGFYIPDLGHTVDVTIEDVNPTTLALTGNASTFIVPYSIPKVTVVFGHVNSSDRSAMVEGTIKVLGITDPINPTGSQTTAWGREPYSGESSYTTEYSFRRPSSYAATITYTDSRGYTGTYEYVPDTWDGSTYFTPVMLADEGFFRVDTSTVVKCRCQAKGWLQSFGAQNNAVTLALQVKEYGEDDTAYVTANTINISSNPSDIQEYTVNYTFNRATSYVCRWVLADKLCTVNGPEYMITTAYPIFGISNGRMDVFGDLHVHDDLYVDSLFYKSGDVISFNQMSLNGFITNNAKTMHITVITGKSLHRISSISVDTMTGSIIGDMGYVNNSSSTTDWLTGFTVSATKKHEHAIELTVTASAAMANVTNNRPIAYYPSNATVGGLVLTLGGS